MPRALTAPAVALIRSRRSHERIIAAGEGDRKRHPATGAWRGCASSSWSAAQASRRYHPTREAASAPARLTARVQRERTRRLGHRTILNRATFGLPAMPLASVAVAIAL